MPFLVPILAAPTSRPGLDQYWIFLERNGNHLMEIPSELADPISAAVEFLTTNDLTPAFEPLQRGDYIFAPVKKTPELSDFYCWRETPPGTTPPRECWRSFLWVSSDDNPDPWGVNALLAELPLGPAPHTAYTVLKTLRDIPTSDFKAQHVTSVDGKLHSEPDSPQIYCDV